MIPKQDKMIKALSLQIEEMLKRLETNTHTKEDVRLLREMAEIVSLFSAEELSGKVSPEKVTEKMAAYYEKKTS